MIFSFCLFALDNDFDVLGEAKEVFQDIYFCIQEVDGDKAASVLKKFIEGNDETENIYTITPAKSPAKRNHRRVDSEFAYSHAVEDCDDDISNGISLHLTNSPSRAKNTSFQFNSPLRANNTSLQFEV